MLTVRIVDDPLKESLCQELLTALIDEMNKNVVSLQRFASFIVFCKNNVVRLLKVAKDNGLNEEEIEVVCTYGLMALTYGWDELVDAKKNKTYEVEAVRIIPEVNKGMKQFFGIVLNYPGALMKFFE